MQHFIYSSSNVDTLMWASYELSSKYKRYVESAAETATSLRGNSTRYVTHS